MTNTDITLQIVLKRLRLVKLLPQMQSQITIAITTISFLTSSQKDKKTSSEADFQANLKK